MFILKFISLIHSPVMVWIHGGAFILGSNSKDFYNPEFLLRKDVVVIAINYRLGCFGKIHFIHAYVHTHIRAHTSTHTRPTQNHI